MTFTSSLIDSRGDTIGFITAAIALSTLDEEASRLIPYGHTSTFILADDGTMLDFWPENTPLRADIKQIKESPDFGKYPVASKEITVGGEQYICSYTSIKGLNLKVCTVTPISSIRHVTTRIKFPILLIITLGFLILVCVLRAIMSRHLKPLASLTKAANKIGEGDFEVELPDMTGYTDLRQLCDAMAHMTQSLRQYIIRTTEAARLRERMASELDIARSIQQSMLPQPAGEIAGADGRPAITIGAMQESALEVGGDLYDYLELDGSLYFIIADVSGKGIPAAMMMTYIKSLFHFAAQQKLQPGEIVSTLNENMCENNINNMFATLLAGRIDIADSRMVIANAGHTPAVVAAGGMARLLNLPPGLPVGIMPEVTYTQKECVFEPGTTLFMYTDGLSEAEDSAGRQFGIDRVVASVNAAGDDPSTIVSTLSEEINKFSVSHQADDITMLCIKAPIQNSVSLSLGYDVREILRMNVLIESFAKSHHWTDDALNNVTLIAEEVVSNVINHSVDVPAESEIRFELCQTADEVRLIVIDPGHRFNPLENRPEVDVTLSLEERRVGGLGIFLVCSLADACEYEYKDGHNHLTIRIKMRGGDISQDATPKC